MLHFLPGRDSAGRSVVRYGCGVCGEMRKFRGIVNGAAFWRWFRQACAGCGNVPTTESPASKRSRRSSS